MATVGLRHAEGEDVGLVRDVCAKDAGALVDPEARCRLDMSGEEFIEKFDARYWPDPLGDV